MLLSYSLTIITSCLVFENHQTTYHSHHSFLVIARLPMELAQHPGALIRGVSSSLLRSDSTAKSSSCLEDGGCSAHHAGRLGKGLRNSSWDWRMWRNHRKMHGKTWHIHGKTWENPDMLGGTILPFKHPPSVLVSSFSLSLSVRFCVERPGWIHSEIDRPNGRWRGTFKGYLPSGKRTELLKMAIYSWDTDIPIKPGDFQ